jgi:hypothetical protein
MLSPSEIQRADDLVGIDTEPVAPASRSGSSVIASSPSHGPSIASPPSADQLAQLGRRAGGLDLEVRTVFDLLRHSRARNAAERTRAG